MSFLEGVYIAPATWYREVAIYKEDGGGREATYGSVCVWWMSRKRAVDICPTGGRRTALKGNRSGYIDVDVHVIASVSSVLMARVMGQLF